MTPFKFRLQTLMRVRIAERDEKRAKLAEAYHAERILLGRIEELATDIEEVRNRSRQASAPGEVNIDTLLNTHRYELLLATQKKSLEQQLVQVRAEVERRRETLVEADRQVRMLEKLRDKRQTEHQQWEAKQEIKTLDEIGTRGWAKITNNQ